MTAKFIIQPNQPDVLVFENGGGAVKITAFGLVGNDCLKFKRVTQESGRPNFEKSGCSVHAPTAAEIALSAPYQVGDCEPAIHAGRNTIFITESGRFLPVLIGSESLGSLAVQVESVPMKDFSAAELGVAPCGCPSVCVDETWEWTGAERCNDENVERQFANCGNTEWRVHRAVEWWETGVTRCRDFRVQLQQESECGKVRWVNTDELCDISPSLPLLIQDGCCNTFVGYVFHPDEQRDPAATVELADCEGNVVGFAYPTAATNRTLAITDCEGEIYGYAMNQSPSGALFAPCDAEHLCAPMPVHSTIPEVS